MHYLVNMLCEHLDPGAAEGGEEDGHDNARPKIQGDDDDDDVDDDDNSPAESASRCPRACFDDDTASLALLC